MNGHSDPEATPRPLHLIKNADVADRTPYIPRRKSSVGRRYGSRCRDVSTIMAPDPPQKASHVWPKHHHSVKKSHEPKKERRLSRASFSKVASRDDVYNSAVRLSTMPPLLKWLTDECFFQGYAQSHQPLPHHDRSSISSSESRSRRRLFSRIISSFTHNSSSTQAISTLAKSLGVEQGQMPRLSGSTARVSSSRTSSMASTESTETSLVRVDPSRTHSANKPTSPNPLRAPPLCLLGQRDNSQHLRVDQRLPSTSSLPDETPTPALATATLHSISDITKADVERATTVWIAVDVQCDIHYAEDPTSSLRSKALGPPHTDPGFLSKLTLDLAPASGCSILRLVGSDSRDFLLPGETWSVVAQILADPPFRRKQPAKAFSLQSRPSSHALMDHLHTMLSPSGPSSQDVVHVSLTFEHALLPSNIQCCVSEKVSLERVSAWSLESRRQQYLRHRHSPRKTPRGPDQEHRQQRDEVACKLLDVLELNLHAQNQSSATTGGHGDSTRILEEFFAGFDGSTRLQQRARELLRALEAKIRPVSRAPVSPMKRSRNGMELSREEAGLVDITNRWSPSSSSRRGRRSRDVSTPAPLFSPRKRKSVRDLPGNGDASPAISMHSPTKSGWGKHLSDQSGGGADVGSPRFYEDEVDEASRIWRGMRDSSAGSSCSFYPGVELCGVDGERKGDGDENGRGVVGAPWL